MNVILNVSFIDFFMLIRFSLTLSLFIFLFLSLHFSIFIQRKSGELCHAYINKQSDLHFFFLIDLNR